MKIPTSTYRIQFSKDFTFSSLENIIDYLDGLGVGALYASPIFEASPGSVHGYDVTNPSKINPEIGTYDQFVLLSRRLKEKNILWLQDIVPNHMAFSLKNTRLFDVLERGTRSSFAHYFDIDRNHHNINFQGRIMLPVLGDDLKTCICHGDIQLKYSPSEGFFFCCYEKNYPLNPDSYNKVLSQLSVAIDFTSPGVECEYELWSEEKANLFTILDTVIAPEEISALSENQTFIIDLLHDQHYWFCKWSDTDSVINYRRFFTVNDLIGVRQEEETVFNDYHRFIHELYGEGLIHGVRIDHIDGLYDPRDYIERLRNLLGPDAYIICEKILEQKEVLPLDWKLEGTSGYEFLSYVNKVVTEKSGAEQIRAYYENNICAEQYGDIVFEKKFAFLHKYMRGELDNLFRTLKSSLLLESANQKHKEALGVFMAAFPVYRIYLSAFPRKCEAEAIETALDLALKKRNDLLPELTELRTVFLSDNLVVLSFLKRLMQFTGPLAAKGVEDTTFYIYNALISHNEVGDSPEEFYMSPSDFYSQMEKRQSSNPFSLNNTSTHDTKRGEDARMRINALTYLPERWKEKVQEWNDISAAFLTQIDGEQFPTVNDRYFIYQAMVGGVNRDFVFTEE